MNIYRIFLLLAVVFLVAPGSTSTYSNMHGRLAETKRDGHKKVVTKGRPELYKKINIPDPFLTSGEGEVFSGDIRIGDLTGNGQADLLVYRAARGASDGATKPNFLGAFTMEGKILWQKGEGGTQPSRPGPVAIYDIDNDGQDEVITFFYQGQTDEDPYSMAGITIRILNGKTGQLKRQSRPEKILNSQGQGANWVHQRILIANLEGHNFPRDLVIKLGKTVFALDHQLNILWTYYNPKDAYSRSPAYIPAVGDIDGDGKDEVNGGYYLLDDNGDVLWENMLGRNMDSVAIDEWDNGNMRAFCSGYGHVMDKEGNIVLKLGKELVPHGQELRVAHFDDNIPGPQMMIRYNGHRPDVMLVANTGEVLRKFTINESPNNTGMEAIYWHGKDQPALLYNGGMLWNGDGTKYADLGLPEPVGDGKMGWYHCIPADLAGDEREEMMIYNPWDANVYIFTPLPVDREAYKGYDSRPRQYNVRLMD